MKILIVGGGGREHALAWKVAEAPRVKTVFVAPGNAGTAKEAKVVNVSIAADDIEGLLKFALEEDIDLTIVGPEVPLVMGIVDLFQSQGRLCFGPTRAAAQLEGSKSFSKDFMARHGIPTARYQSFEALHPALEYLETQGTPIVIKADGLAAGKGVVIARTLEEGRAAVTDMLSGNVYGNAGHRVVIEEFLTGEEASFIVIADGTYALPMASSQDHKALLEGDLGPNTGGMGAYSPAPVVTDAVHERAMTEVIMPTLRGMAADGHPYTGFLYAGLMIAPDESLRVLEFNCRFGDPETQPIMMRLQGDLAELCLFALSGRLDQVEVQWDPRPALGVVLAAQGYPEEAQKGDVIEGSLDSADPEVKVFHAGTRLEGERTVTAGGRVLCVSAIGDTVRAAKARAYQKIDDIHWQGMIFRRDIGYRAILREDKVDAVT